MRKIDRFDKYMKFRGLNDNKVTVQLGLSNGVLAKSRKPNRDLSDRIIEKIKNFYSDLDIYWLETGEGEMIVRSNFSGNKVEGDVNVLGNNNNVHHCDVVNKLTDQNSRLLSIIEEQMQVIKNLSSR